MTYPRAALVSPETTPYYHCVSRCVRRAFLCGVDRLTGRDFEHRKQWVVNRLAELSEVFTIDLCAYAVMSNHHHLVVRIDTEAAEALADEAVAERWGRLCELPAVVDRFLQGQALDSAQATAAVDRLAEYRRRLADLSWFMRCLNEPIARRANAEDGCTGRFWEGRFKSQALLDEAAVLTCMSYVDLNPVRAGVAATPETSAHTSVLARIEAWHTDRDRKPQDATANNHRFPRLVPFCGPEHRDAPDHLPFAFTDYLALVDWAGRLVRDDKRGVIPADVPAILERLRINPDAYLAFLRAERNCFARAVGAAERLRATAQAMGQRFFKGLGPASALFPQPG